MASTPPATSAARARRAADRRRVTIAARPDASFWLTVTLGPRSLNSRPARLAAAFADGAVEEQRGRAGGPPRKSAVEDTRCVACPPAVQVPSTTPRRSSPSSRDRRRRASSSACCVGGDRVRRRCDPSAAASSAQSTSAASKPVDARRERRAAAAGVEAGDGRDAAASLRAARRECRRATCRTRRRRRCPTTRTRSLHAPYVTIRDRCAHQRSRGAARARRALLSSLHRCCDRRARRSARAAGATSHAESFDELYARGQQANAGAEDADRALHRNDDLVAADAAAGRARHARRRAAVARRAALRRARSARRADRRRSPDRCPGRHGNIQQTTDIGAAQRRIQKYFVDRHAGRAAQQLRHRRRATPSERAGTVPRRRWCRSGSRSGKG